MDDLTWGFSYDGHRVAICDLPAELVADVARNGGVSWTDLIDRHPATDLATGLALAQRIATHLGFTLPDPLTPRHLLEMFVRMDIDMPDVYEEGIPKAEAATSTGGSSGRPRRSAGPRT